MNKELINLILERDKIRVNIDDIFPISESVVKLPKPERNSKGELCRYGIKSHRTGKIISRYKTEKDAIKNLKRIQMFRHMK